MSIGSALNSALSGLAATSRSAEIVSSNLSNALTEGYARRELSLSARDVNGVVVNGVVRIADQAIIGDRLIADAGVGSDQTTLAFLEALERGLGAVDDPLSLTGRLASFDASLIEAAARPDSETRLQGLLNSAESVADGFNLASDEIQKLRVEADRSIARDVERLNIGLQQVADLNADILRTRAAGRDTSALMDRRQQAIDGLSDIVPIQVVPRENETVSLITPTGSVLLDSRPAEIEFTPRPVITPDMSLAAGSLSGLTVNGVEISTSGANKPFSGGRLASNFAIRDELAPKAQADLDAVARSVVDRLQDPAVDATLGPTDAGLFTDGGAFFDPLNEVGLAGRLEVNAAVIPREGGALWRLRDGIGAAVEGPVGDNSLLVSISEAMSALEVPASGSLSSGARSATALAGDLVSLVAVDRLAAEARQSFSASRQESLRSVELAQGVDSDQELQKLLLIEQNYAANARVITTASEMIDRLLAI